MPRSLNTNKSKKIQKTAGPESMSVGRSKKSANPEYLTDLTLVIDLDNTLICTFKKPKEGDLDFLRSPKYMTLRPRIYHKKIRIYEREDDGTLIRPTNYREYEFWGVKRPYVTEFLHYCHKAFKYIIVWSAGCYDYVHTIVKELFKDLDFEPDLIYTGLDTTFDNTLGTIKPLMRIIQENPELELSLKKMVILDDTRSTFEITNYDNGLFIPGYQPSCDPESMLKDDQCLLQAIQKLILPEVVECYDIRKVDLKNTFDIPAEEYAAQIEICCRKGKCTQKKK